MTMKHIGLDGHSIFGAGGLLAAVTLQNYSAAMAALTATCTAAYMLHRAWREWTKKK